MVRPQAASIGSTLRFEGSQRLDSRGPLLVIKHAEVVNNLAISSQLLAVGGRIASDFAES